MIESFGARLRKLRLAAGMSMGELAVRTNYSKSYLSKIENDLKPPTRTLARLCDNAVNAGGALIAQAQPARSTVAADDTGNGEVWVMSLGERGEVRFHQLDRRRVLTGAGAMLGFVLTGAARPTVDEQVIADLRTSFDGYRRLGVRTSPAVVLPLVISHVHAVRVLAEDSAEPARSSLWLLASRVAEYAGWMCQEAGDEPGAYWWTRQAVRFAESGRDHQLASYALVRQAEIALYRQDALSTIELAERAQQDRDAGVRVLGLAARCEAQGHALAGNHDAYLRALDRAEDLLSEPDSRGASSPVLGSSTVSDQVSLARGWALCDLGRAAEAAAVLDRHVAEIPVTARRARARFGARRALAHAFNGEVEQACAALGEVLQDAAHVDSATVRVDLRQLARTLARWHNHSAVRDIYPDLNSVLRTRQPAS